FFVALSNDSIPRQRRFVIPAGKYVLITPAVAAASQSVFGFDQSETQLRNRAAGLLATANSSAHVTLDGTPFNAVLSHRETSPPFEIDEDVPANNPLAPSFPGGPGLPGGPSGMVVSDGYFLMLAPLTPGVHTIEFGASGNFEGQPLTVEVTDSVTVPPAPAV